MYSQVGFLWQSNGTCVTDCFYSLQYQSYFVSHVPKAQFASFHLQCLCCHQKPAVCKYTSLAPLYRQMGYWWRFYGLQYVVTLCCQIGGTAGSLVIRSHSACCVCVMALMYLFMSLAYNYAAECSIARLLSSGVCHVLWCRSCSVGKVRVLCCDQHWHAGTLCSWRARARAWAGALDSAFHVEGRPSCMCVSVQVCVI